MAKRKLQALDYPLADSFNIQDEPQFRNLVVWLEDNKIRHYSMEGREDLRNMESDKWPNHFDKYIQDLQFSPTGQLSKRENIDLLLSMAVNLEYNDKWNLYANASSEKVNSSEKEQAPKIVAVNPLDKLDFSSPEFVEGVNDLADFLKVTKHQNHLITLEGCAKLIKTRYSKEAIKVGENLSKKGEPFPFLDVDKSFDTGDNVLNKAGKILRLLFITDLRDLQTKINECIVAVQSITANPKTDTKLGKVGY